MRQEQKKAVKELSSSLLDEVKDALSITWDDEDKNITSLTEASIYEINELVGVELDLEINLSARKMVIQRTRYDYNNALDEFEENYSKPLSRLILNVAIDERKKADNGN
ncbi:hypothetical protein P4J60_20900 [Bacillus cereus]|nr:hypothetical protein [Bacillus cereus]MEB9569675.1 hypothetical protein [Bacillus cereus]